jgi:hypothetical protein
MRRWYTVKVKYTKKIEKNGEENFKQVNESFLLPAVSCTDAEARVTKEIGKSAQGEFLISAMSVTEVADIFRNDDGGQWYQCKITISEEDDNGKVSKTKQNYMIEAFSVQEATTRLDSELEDAMFDYEPTSTTLTSIMDVFYDDLDVEISRTAVESNS